MELFKQSEAFVELEAFITGCCEAVKSTRMSQTPITDVSGMIEVCRLGSSNKTVLFVVEFGSNNGCLGSVVNMG